MPVSGADPDEDARGSRYSAAAGSGLQPIVIVSRLVPCRPERTSV
jgi:hypothetical protein